MIIMQLWKSQIW